MSTKQGFILGSSHARKELSVLDTRADIWGGSSQSPLTWLLNGATHAGSERSKPSVWLMFTTRRLTVRSPLPSELRTLQSRSRKLTDDDKVLVNKRAGGDGGIASLSHAGRAWPAAPHHDR